MLPFTLKKELKEIVNDTLDRCEKQWANTLGKEKLVRKAFTEAFGEATNIPGHPYLDENQYKSDLFVAMIVDMRQSTNHLRQAINAKVSQMQRVFYEVSALLPPMARIINDHKGAVTEYLGDGLLALFQLPRNPKEQEPILRSVINATKQCMDTLEEVINPTLSNRYYLPKLSIGIGLAFSDAIISHFGLPPDTQVKVLGECIYFASECSKEWNEIVLHENLERIWPTTKDGKLSFRYKKIKDINGYILNTLLSAHWGISFFGILSV